MKKFICLIVLSASLIFFGLTAQTYVQADDIDIPRPTSDPIKDI